MAGCSSLSCNQISAYNDSQCPGPTYARIQRHQKLELTDVVDMSKTGVRSSQIITYLSFSGTEFNLSPQDVENLRREGVDGDVITYMREKPDDKGGFFHSFFSLDQ